MGDHVKAGLDSLDWTDSSVSQRPFGAPQVEVRTGSAWAEGVLKTDVKPGQVYVSLGPEFSPTDEELGGPLVSQEYPIFFDIFMDSEAAALALANDIRDWLLARLDGSSRAIPVVNQFTSAEVDGWLLELDDVERRRPDAAAPLHWQVVNVTATALFQEVA